MLKGTQGLLGIGMTTSITEFGKFLRTRRLELQLSQAQVAILLGIKQNRYSLIEIGKKRRFEEKQLEKISKALQCSFFQLEVLMFSGMKDPETELGKFIRARREEMGLTLRDLAEKLKISREEAMKIELKKAPWLIFKISSLLVNALEIETLILDKLIGKKTSALGRFIRSRRLELGLSIRELAKRAGVTFQLVSLIECGGDNLSRDNNTIKNLAKALEIEIGVLKSLRKMRKKGTPYNTKFPRTTVLGKFLTDWRREINFRQGDIAREAGISMATLRNVETKSGKYRTSTLFKISKALMQNTS